MLSLNIIFPSGLPLHLRAAAQTRVSAVRATRPLHRSSCASRAWTSDGTSRYLRRRPAPPTVRAGTSAAGLRLRRFPPPLLRSLTRRLTSLAAPLYSFPRRRLPIAPGRSTCHSPAHRKIRNYRDNPAGEVRLCGLSMSHRQFFGWVSFLGAVSGLLWLINPQLCFSLQYKVTSYAIVLVRAWETGLWMSRFVARKLSKIEGQPEE